MSVHVRLTLQYSKPEAVVSITMECSAAAAAITSLSTELTERGQSVGKKIHRGTKRRNPDGEKAEDDNDKRRVRLILLTKLQS